MPHVTVARQRFTSKAPAAGMIEVEAFLHMQDIYFKVSSNKYCYRPK